MCNIILFLYKYFRYDFAFLARAQLHSSKINPNIKRYSYDES